MTSPADVTGEDFIRLDWRVGVAFEGWGARFRGLDVDEALRLRDFCGIVSLSNDRGFTA